MWIILIVPLIWPALSEARSIRLRSGDHAEFSRLVLPAAGSDWRIAPEAAGFVLMTAESDLRFETQTVFDLISRERLMSVEDRGQGQLLLKTAPGMAPTGYYYNDAYVIDIGPSEDSPAPVPGPETATPPDPATPPGPAPPLVLSRPPLAQERRDAGGINGLSGLGPAAARTENGLDPVESALLFQVARAAAEGTLQVADPELLALRQAEAASQKAPDARDASDPGDRAQQASAPLECETAIDLLSFEAVPPRDRAEAEAAYLELDGERSNARVIELAKAFMAIGLLGESRRILDLAPEQNQEIAVLRDISLLMEGEAADSTRLDTIRQCAPSVELWRLAAPEPSALHSEPYAIFTAYVALPPVIRAALKRQLDAELSGRHDAVAQTLLSLISQAPTPCYQTDACTTDPEAQDLLEQVKALSVAGREEFAAGSQAIFDNLLAANSTTEPSLPLYLEAIAYERADGQAGLSVRLSAILAHSLAQDFATAFHGYLALSSADRTESATKKSLKRIAETFVSTADDDAFLKLSFEHAGLLRECCQPAYADLLARLGTFGFVEADLAGAASIDAKGLAEYAAGTEQLPAKGATASRPPEDGSEGVARPPVQMASEPGASVATTSLDEARRLMAGTETVMSGLRDALGQAQPEN